MKLDAKELKELLGEEARYIIESGLGLTGTNHKKRCPNKSAHSNGDKDPSMSWYKDGLMYKCFACGEHIDIYDYYSNYKNMSFQEALEEVARLTNSEVDYKREFKEGKPIEKAKKAIKAKEKEYSIPNIKTQALSQEGIDYMALRGITKDTLDTFMVEERIWGGKPRYVFNYYDESGELVYVSYRAIGKAKANSDKGGCEANTKAILWNMQAIDKEKPVIICEGQMDAMIIHQSGYTNVVSVPAGSNNDKWIDHCWDWLQDIPEFVVWADNDVPGLKMAQDIERRLANVKVMVSEDAKDANELHFRKGPEAVYKLIIDKIQEIPDGMLEVSRLKYDSALNQEEGIETGFYEIDKHLEDLRLGEATVVFGRNNEGKTTMVSQMIGHCLSESQKVFMYSGEMTSQKLQAWIYKQLIGDHKKFMQKVNTKYRTVNEPKPEVVQAIKEWHQDLFYLYDNNYEVQGDELDFLFETMKLASRRYGVKLFIIDNLMSILETSDSKINSDQTNLMRKINRFVKRENAHIILVAHPNKHGSVELVSGTQGNLTKNDISGTGNIANNVDNIISVERFWHEDREADAVFTILKNREDGVRKSFLFYFSLRSLRYYNAVTPETVVYDWHQSAIQKMEKKVRENLLDVPVSAECPF